MKTYFITDNGMAITALKSERFVHFHVEDGTSHAFELERLVEKDGVEFVKPDNGGTKPTDNRTKDKVKDRKNKREERERKARERHERHGE